MEDLKSKVKEHWMHGESMLALNLLLDTIAELQEKVDRISSHPRLHTTFGELQEREKKCS